MELNSLTDRQLLSNTENLAKQEREILVQVLWHLAEIQRRKLFSPRYRSLFNYAVARLGYSEDQAARRIAAMRLLVELPEIESNVANGKLGLTQLGIAQTYFRAEKSARAQSAQPDREEKLETLKLLEGKTTREASRILIKASTALEKMRPETVRPISATVSEIRLSVKEETLGKITQLKGLLASKHPHLSTAELLDLVFDIALEKLNPARPPLRKSANRTVSKIDSIGPGDGAVSGPQNVSCMPNVRTPRADIKRSVWVKAQGRCEMCASTHMLEIDHKKPFALGGITAAENLRLLCRNCNQRASIRLFGARDYPKRAKSLNESTGDKNEGSN